MDRNKNEKNNDAYFYYIAYNFSYFTWDAHKFADPKKMLSEMAVKHRKMVTIIDPHLKKDDGYPVGDIWFGWFLRPFNIFSGKKI